MEQNQSMVILNLKWKNMQKKLYLGVDNSEESKKQYETALKEIEAMGDAADNWQEFYNNAIDIFKSHGIIRVDH